MDGHDDVITTKNEAELDFNDQNESLPTQHSTGEPAAGTYTAAPAVTSPPSVALRLHDGLLGQICVVAASGLSNNGEQLFRAQALSRIMMPDKQAPAQ